MTYKSQRISLSYPAVERLREIYNLPEDIPPQTLAGYVERMIFEFDTGTQKPTTTITTTPTPTATASAHTPKANFNKLSAMATKKP